MREPARIVASLEMATQLREALERGTKAHESTGWDDGVFYVELGRLAGSLLRWRDARPSEVEQLVDTLRQVHAGLVTHRAPQAEDVVAALCPPDSAGASGANDGVGTRTVQ